MSDYRNEQAIAAEAPEQSVSAGGYRALAVISFVLAAGGLFLGLLVKWTDIFTHWMYTASQGAALSGSLIDYLIEYAKSVYEVGVWTYIKGLFGNPFNVAGLSQFLTALMTAAAVVIALVTLVVSFCSRKAAKNCAMTSLVCVLLGYGGLFAYAFFTARFLIGEIGFSRMMFDIPTAIVAGVALICLVIAAIARRKGMGLLNFVLFLLTALCIYSLCNSRSAMVLLMATDIKEEIFFSISAIALFALLSLNFLASSVRLTAKKAYVFDAVRYGLLLAAAVCTVISYGLMLEWANFKEDLLNTVLLLAAPLAAFLLSIVIAIAQASAARRMEAEEESKAISAAYTQPQPAALPAAAPAAASGVVTEGSQDVARNVTVNVQPKPAEAQTPQNVTVNVTPAMYGQQPMMPFYPMPYYTAPVQQQQPVQPAPAFGGDVRTARCFGRTEPDDAAHADAEQIALPPYAEGRAPAPVFERVDEELVRNEPAIEHRVVGNVLARERVAHARQRTPQRVITVHFEIHHSTIVFLRLSFNFCKILRSMRETFICETPMRFAVSIWESSSPKRYLTSLRSSSERFFSAACTASRFSTSSNTFSSAGRTS